MVLTTKLIIAVAAVGVAVPLSTNLQKSAPVPTDPLLGRFTRCLAVDPESKYIQYIELQPGGRYAFATIINGETQESGTGTWKRTGQKVVFQATPGSKTALALEEADVVDSSTLRFSVFHAFCKRSHPHEAVGQSTGLVPARKTAQPAIPPTRTATPATQTERDLIATLRAKSYVSPDKMFVVDAGDDGAILVTINQVSSKAQSIEAKVAAYLKKYGITDIAHRRETSRLVYFYECPG